MGEETASRDNNLEELQALSLEETRLKESVFRDGCVGKQFNIWGLEERVLKSDLIVTPDPILTNCVASKSHTTSHRLFSYLKNGMIESKLLSCMIMGANIF